jgi:hypothetical protein
LWRRYAGEEIQENPFMGTLWSDFLSGNKYQTLKWRHYFSAYERHFSRFINQDVTFLEIGTGEGGSSQMWKRFFGPHARIVSIDVRPSCAQYSDDQVFVRIGSQGDNAFLDTVLAEFGTPDIVLDDGSHTMSHMHSSFAKLYPLLPHNGVYMIEDTHTCYDPDFGGGLRNPASFMETCKGLIDELHADYIGSPQATPFGLSTLSMHFYDSIVVFEKGRQITPKAIITI